MVHHMPLMDEFKEERESVKKGSVTQKAAYFWDYHKWHMFLALIVIAFVANYIYSLVSKPETLLNGILLNSYSEDFEDPSEELVSAFLTEQHINPAKYDVYLDTSLRYTTAEPSGIIASNYQTMQVILARSTIGDLDLITADLNSMIDLAYKDLFWNLTEVLSDEQLSQYESYFCYIDLAVVRELDEANARNEDTSHIVFPDYSKPETMEEPIPALIDVSKSEPLRSAYGNAYDALAIGIVNDTNIEMSLRFLDFLIGYRSDSFLN